MFPLYTCQTDAVITTLNAERRLGRTIRSPIMTTSGKSTNPPFGSTPDMGLFPIPTYGLGNCPFGSGLIHLPNLASYIRSSNIFQFVKLSLSENCPWYPNGYFSCVNCLVSIGNPNG